MRETKLESIEPYQEIVDIEEIEKVKRNIISEPSSKIWDDDDSFDTFCILENTANEKSETDEEEEEGI